MAAAEAEQSAGGQAIGALAVALTGLLLLIPFGKRVMMSWVRSALPPSHRTPFPAPLEVHHVARNSKRRQPYAYFVFDTAHDLQDLAPSVPYPFPCSHGSTMLLAMQRESQHMCLSLRITCKIHGLGQSAFTILRPSSAGI